MARKTIRRFKQQYQIVKAWLCRSREGNVMVWLGERNEIQYNGNWWERVDMSIKSRWMTAHKSTWDRKARWSERCFAELFDISIDELPALGECVHITIEIEKED